jgi:hypothetical protein
MIFLLNICLTDWFEATSFMVVHQPCYLGLSIAERAGRMLPDWKRCEFRLEGMVNQKLTDQRLPLF